MVSAPDNNIEDELKKDIVKTFYSPYAFVIYNFPWGVPGTDLENEPGPDKWQKDLLLKIGEELLLRRDNPNLGPIQIAIKSGHEVGKTAFIAWIILWFMSTRYDPQVVCTANTGTQLFTKLWRELALWHERALNSHWFEWTKTQFYLKASKTWFASAITWKEEKSDAFAGTHAKYVLYAFDEASGIPDKIWEVSDGAIRGPGSIWIVMGNPTKNTGRFRECFRQFSHRWLHWTVDARDAKISDKEKIRQTIEDYGLDNDITRVRVLGEFPDAATTQFIPTELVEQAMSRNNPPEMYRDWPIIISCDVARFGDDQSIVAVRQGLKVHQFYKYRGLHTMETAQKVIMAYHEWLGEYIFVDVVGIGAGVVDRIRQLGFICIEVNAGNVADEPTRYVNKRAEMWSRMKAWLILGGDLPFDQELLDNLTGIEYGFNQNRNRLQLESKRDMKSRGLPSPDDADALSLSFAYPVAPKIVDDYDYRREVQRQRRLREANPVTGY